MPPVRDEGSAIGDAAGRWFARLQAEGLVETYLEESPSGPSRKYYRLTSAGAASLASQKAAWRSFARSVDQILGGAE